jgi:hypothetical protein
VAYVSLAGEFLLLRSASAALVANIARLLTGSPSRINVLTVPTKNSVLLENIDLARFRG